MDEFIKLLTANPIPATILSIGVVVALIIALRRDTEISIGQFKIGARTPPTINGLGVSDSVGGRIVSKEERSKIMIPFLRATRHSVKSFAGDLSWLERDLPFYIELRARGVEVKILADEPIMSAVASAIAQGIEIRRYPDRQDAPFKAIITDMDEDTQSRVLVIQARTPRKTETADYGYWMKTYHGSDELQVVRAMGKLFDELFSRGEKIQ